MCDLPENLQTIKRELSPSLTPEENSPNSIKAKLNLHVKRRLQDFNQNTEDSPSTAAQCKQLDTPKTETVRQKRPYHKRADKNKTNNPTTATGETPAAAAAASLVGIATTTTPQRKYKHKIKQIITTTTTTTNTLESHQEHNNTEEQTVTTANHHNTALTTGAISAGDDDEGGHDNDMKTVREKEKCPDVLAMVLSMKKRALMQDPEVQKFLKDVMEVIKS